MIAAVIPLIKGFSSMISVKKGFPGQFMHNVGHPRINHLLHFTRIRMTPKVTFFPEGKLK